MDASSISAIAAWSAVVVALISILVNNRVVKKQMRKTARLQWLNMFIEAVANLLSTEGLLEYSESSIVAKNEDLHLKDSLTQLLIIQMLLNNDIPSQQELNTSIDDYFIKVEKLKNGDRRKQKEHLLDKINDLSQKIIAEERNEIFK